MLPTRGTLRGVRSLALLPPWLPPPDTIGAVFGDRYRVAHRIAEGTTGVVYCAEDLRDGGSVALRLLRPELSSSAALFDFLKARIGGRLAIGGLAEVRDVGRSSDGLVYEISDYIDGENLGAQLQRRGRMPWPKARGIVRRLAGILGELHHRGARHGYLQARSCYVLGDGADAAILAPGLDAYLLDIDESLLSAASLTICRYAAPERASGDPSDHRIDLYALGVILYELLTARLPFEDPNPNRLLAMHMLTPPPPPRQVAPAAGIPEAVEALILLALAKDPDARFPTMAAFVAALDACPVETSAPSAAPSAYAPTLVGAGFVGVAAATHAPSPVVAAPPITREPSGSLAASMAKFSETEKSGSVPATAARSEASASVPLTTARSEASASGPAMTARPSEAATASSVPATAEASGSVPATRPSEAATASSVPATAEASGSVPATRPSEAERSGSVPATAARSEGSGSVPAALVREPSGSATAAAVEAALSASAPRPTPFSFLPPRGEGAASRGPLRLPPLPMPGRPGVGTVGPSLVIPNLVGDRSDVAPLSEVEAATGEGPSSAADGSDEAPSSTTEAVGLATSAAATSAEGTTDAAASEAAANDAVAGAAGLAEGTGPKEPVSEDMSPKTAAEVADEPHPSSSGSMRASASGSRRIVHLVDVRAPGESQSRGRIAAGEVGEAAGEAAAETPTVAGHASEATMQRAVSAALAGASIEPTSEVEGGDPMTSSSSSLPRMRRDESTIQSLAGDDDTLATSGLHSRPSRSVISWVAAAVAVMVVGTAGLALYSPAVEAEKVDAPRTSAPTASAPEAPAVEPRIVPETAVAEPTPVDPPKGPEEAESAPDPTVVAAAVAEPKAGKGGKSKTKAKKPARARKRVREEPEPEEDDVLEQVRKYMRQKEAAEAARKAAAADRPQGSLANP
ncbi:MAG: protein kinase [Nannocystaceae bacterium]